MLLISVQKAEINEIGGWGGTDKPQTIKSFFSYAAMNLHHYVTIPASSVLPNVFVLYSISQRKWNRRGSGATNLRILNPICYFDTLMCLCLLTLFKLRNMVDEANAYNKHVKKRFNKIDIKNNAQLNWALAN
jgi:hypothetical protein